MLSSHSRLHTQLRSAETDTGGGGIKKSFFDAISHFKLGKVVGLLFDPHESNIVRILKYAQGISIAEALKSQELTRFGKYTPETASAMVDRITKLPPCLAAPYNLKAILPDYLEKLDPKYYQSADAHEFCADLTRLCCRADLLKQIAGNEFIRNPTEGFFGRLRDSIEDSLFHDSNQWAKLDNCPKYRRMAEVLLDAAVEDFANSINQYFQISMSWAVQIKNSEMSMTALQISRGGLYNIPHVNSLDDPTRQFFLDMELKIATALDPALGNLSDLTEHWISEVREMGLHDKLALFRDGNTLSYEEGGRSPLAFTQEFFVRSHAYMQDIAEIDNYLLMRLNSGADV